MHRSRRIDAVLVFLFVVPAAIQEVFASNVDSEFALIGWMLSFCVVFALLFVFGKRKLPRMDNFIQWLLIFVAVAGLPGLLIMQSIEPMRGIGFFVATVIRLVGVMLLLPKVAAESNVNLAQKGVMYVIASTGAVLAVEFLIAVNAAGSGWGDRLSGRLHPNLLGAYCGAFLICWLVGSRVRMAFRVVIGGFGLWLLLSTQSRTSIGAAVLSILLIGLVYAWRRKGHGVVVGIACLCVVVGATWVGWGRVTESSLWKGIARRTAYSNKMHGDPSSGRYELALDAVDRIAESPWFGYGFMQRGTRFENGVLSLSLETGLVGLAAYVVAMLCIVWKGIGLLLRVKPGNEAWLYALVALCAFVSLRSLGERSHLLQVSDPASNALLMLIGVMLSHAKAGERKVP